MTERPLLRVVRGEPTDEELAALTAVVLAATAAGAADGPGQTSRRSAWADRSALLRRPLFPGPGAWRASALPR